MDSQEIFDTIAQHLFAQGKQSLSENKRCMYRNNEGLKCAVGILIKDEHYSSLMEVTETEEVLESLINKGYDLKERDFNLIEELQFAHDCDSNWKTSEDMQVALFRIGKSNKLNTNILTGLKFKDR